MGKWDRRYRPRLRRRDYQDYHWSPPRDEPCPDPETEDWQDNVPMWEKKFCYLVGRMPWRKVLRTKNLMHCNGNILSWDDSSGKEAFDNAKKRFWEEINELPSTSELPNPDSYIDQIDWNPYIDPEVARDLDRAYFNPDDKYYLPYEHDSKVNNGWPGDDSNPWERAQLQLSAVKDNKATGWNQWDSSQDDGKNNQEPGSAQDSAVGNKATGWNQWDNRANGSETENPWECSKSTGWKQWDTSINTTGKLTGDASGHTKDSKVVRENSWGGAGHGSWGVKPQNQSDLSKNWSAVGSNSWKNEGNRWHDHGPSSRNYNQKSEFHKPNYPNNNCRPHGNGSHQGYRGPRGRGNSWGQRRWDNSSNNNNDNNSNLCGQFNAGCRKREGPDDYVTNHKGPRLQGGYSHSSPHWNGR